jgi:ABC-type Fe3+ transport system permease subunit
MVGNLPYSPEKADSALFEIIGPYTQPAIIVAVVLVFLYMFYKLGKISKGF